MFNRTASIAALLLARALGHSATSVPAHLSNPPPRRRLGMPLIRRAIPWFRGYNDPQNCRRDRECARRVRQIERGVLNPQSRGL